MILTFRHQALRRSNECVERRKRSRSLISVVLLVFSLLGPPLLAAGDQKRAHVGDEEHSKKGVITGKVTNKAGQPIEKATVFLVDKVLQQEVNHVVTDPSGTFKFDSLLPGNYVIYALKNNRKSESEDAKASNGSPYSVTLVITE